MTILKVLGTKGIIFEVHGPLGHSFRGPGSTGGQFRVSDTHMATFQRIIVGIPVTVFVTNLRHAKTTNIRCGSSYGAI